MLSEWRTERYETEAHWSVFSFLPPSSSRTVWVGAGCTTVCGRLDHNQHRLGPSQTNVGKGRAACESARCLRKTLLSPVIASHLDKSRPYAPARRLSRGLCCRTVRESQDVGVRCGWVFKGCVCVCVCERERERGCACVRVRASVQEFPTVSLDFTITESTRISIQPAAVPSHYSQTALATFNSYPILRSAAELN